MDLLVLSSNLLLHSVFIFGVDWTQTTKPTRTDRAPLGPGNSRRRTFNREALSCLQLVNSLCHKLRGPLVVHHTLCGVIDAHRPAAELGYNSFLVWECEDWQTFKDLPVLRVRWWSGFAL